MREWLLVALMLSLCFTGQVVAEEEESDPFTAAGLNLVALRNDSLDSNQDGMMDAIRVVVVINSTEQWADFTVASGETDWYGLFGISDDLNTMFAQAYENGSRVHTNSWGSNAAGQ